jgi:hypothetical protein
MDKDIFEEGLEDYLREKTDEFRLYPSDKVWEGLQKKMHPPRRWPYFAGAIILFGMGLATGMLINNDSVPMNGKETSGNELRNEQDLKSNDLRVKEWQDVFTRSGSPSNGTDKPSNGAWSSTKTFKHSSVSSFGNNGSSFLSVIKPEKFTEESIAPPEDIPDYEKEGAEDANDLSFAKVISMNSRQQFSKASKNPAKASLLVSKSAQFMDQLGRISKKSGIQLYISPTVSYRKLIGQASRSSFSYNGFPYSANFGFPSDVNDAVTHKPALGIELGSALTYPLGRHFRVKAGLQFNLNNYDIEAYSYVPEIASLSAGGASGFSQPISAVSYYRNFSGYSRTWLRNSHFMVSMPLGIEMNLFASKRVSFNVASTIQPTYVINNRSYLISTNLKNYAQEPSLYRKWNVNAGAEAYLSVNTGSYKWIMGPQFRYQIMSSYKDKYPIREHLVDYGFKVGIQKTLK